MKYSKWIGLFGVALTVYAAFQPWVFVVSKNITVTGLNATGTNFGRPAMLNVILSIIAAVFFLAPYVMAKRANLFFCAFNLAWSIRNFIIVSLCRAGECPEKQTGLYLLLIAASLMMFSALFPDIKLKKEEAE
jgi:hypothetical protein